MRFPDHLPPGEIPSLEVIRVEMRWPVCPKCGATGVAVVPKTDNPGPDEWGAICHRCHYRVVRDSPREALVALGNGEAT